ncbi:MAG: hypothetical protein JXJ17_04295 [Anaerolineae bacterium]|nr:hypothetical protein [Anaerolineae bacterium]
MELNDFLSILSQALLIIALPIIIAAAVQTFRVQTQKLKDNIGEDRFNALKSIVQTAVQVAEQTGVLEKLTGSEKRNQAVDFVQSWLRDHNVNIDVDQIASLVEAEVLTQFQNPTAPVNTAESRQQLIDKAVESAVLAAEQSGLKGLIQNLSAEKKAYAMQMSKEYLAQHGINIPDTLIDGMIEATLLRYTLAARGQLPDSGGQAAG